MKKNLFEVDNKEKIRILNLHTINEQRNYGNSVNVGGKIIPTSKQTMDFYEYAQSGNKDSIINYMYNLKSKDWNLINDELKNKLNTNIENLLHKVFSSSWASRRQNSHNILTNLKKNLSDYVDFTWNEIHGQYNGGLKVIIKNPNDKYDTRTDAEKQQEINSGKQQRFQNLKSAYCGVKNGKLIVGGQEQTWDWYVQTYKITQEEMEAAKKFCPQSELATTLPAVVVKGKKTNQTKKITRVKENFPLKKGMFGDNVKKLQQKLNVKPTGFFWNLTQNALIKKMKEIGKTYNPNVGLEQSDFNNLMGEVTPDYPGGVKPNP